VVLALGAALATSAAVQPAAAGTVHVVQRGETLAGIARAAGTVHVVQRGETLAGRAGAPGLPAAAGSAYADPTTPPLTRA